MSDITSLTTLPKATKTISLVAATSRIRRALKSRGQRLFIPRSYRQWNETGIAVLDNYYNWQISAFWTIEELAEDLGVVKESERIREEKS